MKIMKICSKYEIKIKKERKIERRKDRGIE